MKPQVVNIFGKTYKIQYKEMEEDLYGECKNDEFLIEIDRNQTGEKLIHTLLHEYFHAVIYRVGLKQVLSHDVEEMICENFATFLCDNKLVIPKEGQDD